jgi:hypothetical protein
LSIVVSGERIVFQEVPDGSTVSAPFPSHGYDEFAIIGSLSDGTPLKGGFGFRAVARRVVLAVESNGTLKITQGH